MDKPGFTSKLRQALFAGLTNRAGDVTGQPTGELRAMLQAAFGEGRRAGGVDTRAAAEGLGVTQRTVQRWLAGAGRQSHRASPEHLQAIARRARQAASTQAGRRASTAGLRQGLAARASTRLKVTGDQGPVRDGKAYGRHRAVAVDLQPEDVDGLMSAYERGGDRAAVDWLENHFDGNYVDNWAFETITELSLGDPEDPAL